MAVIIWDKKMNTEICVVIGIYSQFSLKQLDGGKIWSFHCSNYEDIYKNPDRTSEETHYVSATEPSQLMLCKVWGFRDGDYEACRLLGCYSVWNRRFGGSDAPIMKVTSIYELGTTLAVTSNRRTLRRNAMLTLFRADRCILCISSQRASVASYC
jgi:hypothetical protein